MGKLLLLVLAIVLLICSVISIVRGNEQTAMLFGVLGMMLIALHIYMSNEETPAGQEEKKAERRTHDPPPNLN